MLSTYIYNRCKWIQHWIYVIVILFPFVIMIVGWLAIFYCSKLKMSDVLKTKCLSLWLEFIQLVYNLLKFYTKISVTLLSKFNTLRESKMNSIWNIVNDSPILWLYISFRKGFQTCWWFPAAINNFTEYLLGKGGQFLNQGNFLLENDSVLF